MTQSGSGVTIGGTAPGTGNVISGNAGMGIDFYNANFHVIQGNYIGVDQTGSGPLGNGLDGLWIRWGSSNNTIGGDAPGAANIIAHNGRNGVTVSETVGEFVPVLTPATGNSIRRNSIYANAALGIDLAERHWNGSGFPDDARNNSYVFGVTPNDPLDADAGNNQWQNFPVLAAASSGASTRVQGSLHSTPNGTFVIDFYANSAADSSGYGEGERWVGSATPAASGVPSGKCRRADSRWRK
ncbi:MAG: hypothetical protein HY000_40245 [Planctomycetes bacterium]|nr:hypothetical protein [Planctomycetota bacterium]